jgi:hypothetical protein
MRPSGNAGTGALKMKKTIILMVVSVSLENLKGSLELGMDTNAGLTRVTQGNAVGQAGALKMEKIIMVTLDFKGPLELGTDTRTGLTKAVLGYAVCQAGMPTLVAQDTKL